MAKLDLLGQPFPVLRKRLDFGEFHEDLAGNYVEVWLNLSDEFEDRVADHQEQFAVYKRRAEALTGAIEAGRLKGGDLEDAQRELQQRSEDMNRATAEIYAELWNCEVEEYRQLVVIEGPLTTWLMSRTWDLIEEYRSGRGKAPSD